MTTLDQTPVTIDLKWVEGDPVLFDEITISDADWSGALTAKIRDRDGTIVGELVPAATYGAPNTELVLTMSAAASANIPAGMYSWVLQETGGYTRARGRVTVQHQT